MLDNRPTTGNASATVGKPSGRGSFAHGMKSRTQQIRTWAGCVILLAVGLVVTIAVAQDDGGFINREYPLKALFLYNFGGYVEWPSDTFADAQSPFVIGVMGTTALDETLNQIALQKNIGGRRILIQRFASVDDVKKCQMLFISRTVPRAQQQQLIEKLRGQPILTVGEMSHFAKDGGCINFFVEANKIHFEINVAVVKAQGLKVNSKLLAMARIVGQTSAESR